MSGLHPLNGEFAFDRIIGTGGIGSGMVFHLEGSHTLGRNESRLGILLPAKDYCKLHIITHYLSIMLPGQIGRGVSVYPVGKVGDDEIGHRLLTEMRNAGLIVDFVEAVPQYSTLFSVCFLYPDSSGGNITTMESASSKVTPDDVTGTLQKLLHDHDREMFLAAPEVPLPARLHLLKTGKERGGFTVSVVLSGEVDEFRESGGFENTDLLAVNIDEARAITQMSDENIASKTVVGACVDTLRKINPELSIVITDGAHGSYGYQSGYLEFVPALVTDVASSAGAGDAFLSGIMIGLCCGLPLLKGVQDTYFGETAIHSAMEFGTLLGSLSVTSMDTIHHGANAASLFRYARARDVRLSDEFLYMFGEFS